MILDIIKYPLFPPPNPVRSCNFPFSLFRCARSQANSSSFSQCYIKQWLKPPFLLSFLTWKSAHLIPLHWYHDPLFLLAGAYNRKPFSPIPHNNSVQSLFFLLFSYAKLPMCCLLSVHCCSACCDAIPLSSSRLSSYSPKRSCRQNNYNNNTFEVDNSNKVILVG